MRATFSPRCLFLAVTALAVFTAPKAGAQPPAHHVFAIGVSQYQSINSADGSDHDAERVGATLKGRKLAEKPLILTNKAATVTAVKAGLRGLKDRARPGEAVILFFAGHGVLANKGTEWAFLPYDFDPKSAKATLIWDDEILDAASELVERGHDVLLAIDACHSGAVIRRAEERGLVGGKRIAKAGRGTLVIATACRPDQLSTATAEAGKFAGWFTTAFAEVLSGKADANRDGVVSVAEMRGYLEARLFVITHKRLKEPGLAWAAQDSLVASSPGAPEGFGVVRGDRKAGIGPQEVGADFVPDAPDIFAPARPAAAPVGTWTIAKIELVPLGGPGKKTLELRGEYTLTLRADGTYTAKLKLSEDRTEVTEGTYTYEAGGSFALSFSGGEDKLLYFGSGKDWMTVRVQSKGSQWSGEFYYQLKRVGP